MLGQQMHPFRGIGDSSVGAYVGAANEMVCVVCVCCRGGIVVMDMI